jgi:hypothetical protein
MKTFPWLAVGGADRWTAALPDAGTFSLFHVWLGAFVVGCFLALVLGRCFGHWARLVEAYPATPRQGGRGRLWVGLLIFGRGRIRNSTWVEIDEGHLHVWALKPLHVVRAPFSVPLADVTATPDVWLDGLLRRPVVRLTLAREPSLRIMVTPPLFERLAAMSDGRLRVGASQNHPSEPEDSHEV